MLQVQRNTAIWTMRKVIRIRGVKWNWFPNCRSLVVITRFQNENLLSDS